MRAVILAGGKGTRLRPYTIAIPKPLVPIVDDTPILGVLIGQLKKQGFSHITLAVSHMADMIKSYAGDGSQWGLKIDYSFEETPLHTTGALTLIPDLPEHFLVINGDTLSDLDYGTFLKEHVEMNNMLSVSVKSREVKTDFGVVTFDENNHLTSFIEKPIHHSFVAMGANCFSKKLIDEKIPKNTWYGFDKLLLECLADGTNVWVYPHEGFWIDIGRPEDYQFVIENSETIKKFL
ncbi:MAG: sugar phosphate nucleotidyltransferase [Candidatus Adlerbacteria bacterium]|nr:sugar phosphate nucleotidyltransferase [Candidatus Adlerbacteria bacterium]